MGHPLFQWKPGYTQFPTINMYLLIEIRHDILIECHGNYIEEEKFNYMLKNDILKMSSQNNMCVLMSEF